HWSALCPCQRVFAPRQHLYPRAPARSVGTAHALYRPWCRVAGAPPGRRQRRSRLYLHPPVVGRDDWDSALAAGTPGEARGVGPPATRPSGALWRVPRAAQPSAWGDYPDATSARPRRAGGVPHVASLELGTAAPAGL